jgi:hypothetical protein
MASGITLAEAQVLRTTAFKAYQKALTSKAVDAGQLKTQRQSIDGLRADFQYWDRYLQYLMGNGTSMEFRSLVPGDL